MLPPISHLGVATLATTWVLVCIALATVIWATIIAARRHKRMWLGLDEGVTIFAMMIGVGLACQTTAAIIIEGRGEHQNELTASQVSILARSLIVHEVLWIAVNGLIRIVAYRVLLRVFRISISNPLDYAVKFLLGLTILYPIASILEVMLICRPLATQWNNSHGTCGNQKLSFVTVEILGLLLDLPLFLIPISVISQFNWSLKEWSRLNWSLKERLRMVLVLEIGSIVFVVTILRLKSLYLATSSDFVYAKSYLGLLSAVGTLTSIALAQVAVLSHLGRRARLIWESWKAHKSPSVLPEETDRSIRGTVFQRFWVPIETPESPIPPHQSVPTV